MPSFVSFDALLTMLLREQFRISFGDIKIAILELNEDILDAETVEKMIPVRNFDSLRAYLQREICQHFGRV